MTCNKCGGYGWLWWNELDHYSGPAIETGQDDTKYTCDACHAETLNHTSTTKSEEMTVVWLNGATDGSNIEYKLIDFVLMYRPIYLD